MSFVSTNNPCLCESGLDYLYCCGAPDRKELNIVARLSSNSNEIIQSLSAINTKSLDDISLSPEWFPVSIDPATGVVRLVKMSPFWYSESTFLDTNRILGTYAVEVDMQWLLQHSQQSHWHKTPIIFHTAFCGSTLVSKALSTLYDCLPVREPDILASFFSHSSKAFGLNNTAYIEKMMSLLSRRFQPQQPVVIKANDHSNRLMDRLLSLQPESPALFMYIPLHEFVAACLKDPGRRSWIKDRYLFVKRQLPTVFPDIVLDDLDEDAGGAMAAVYWSYNLQSYLEAHKHYPDTIRCLEFNHFLSNPLGFLESCASWFGLQDIKGTEKATELKQIMGVYSKGGQAYSPEKRRQEIDQLVLEKIDGVSEAIEYAHILLGDIISKRALPGHLEIRNTEAVKRHPVKRLLRKVLFSEHH